MNKDDRSKQSDRAENLAQGRTEDSIYGVINDESWQALRARAEERVRPPENFDSLSPEEIRQMLYELQVRQLELEMQNEELRHTQATLEGVRMRYFDLYDLAPIGYCTLSEKGLILEANLTAATLLDVPRSTLVNKPLSLFIFKEDQDIYYTYRKQLVEASTLQVCELRMVKKDGATFWAYLEAVAQDASAGTAPAGDDARGYRLVISDITGRKQAEEERLGLEQRLQQLQKTESLGHMAGAVAHHFNNQLQAVMGNLEFAMQDLPQEVGDVRKDLTEAMQAARKATEVSALMLIYLGQATGKRTPLDLSAACSRTLPLIQATIPKGVVLEVDLRSPGPSVSADANQLQQVLTNLTTNAWEAADDGRAVINLTVKTVSSAAIPALHRFPLDWQPGDNRYACLEVRDTGGGIADKDIDKVFDPFFSSKFTGRGLGLSVVLGIIKAHGGAVRVDSKAGRGSVFQVFFPLSAELVPPQPDKAANVLEIKEGGTVLLVEDEEMVRKMAATMLKRLGFTVLTTKDGVEALEVFQERQDEIRAVLCDLSMPRMNGWETLTALRKLAPGIPVVLASGYDQVQVMAGDHPEQPQAFLHKPYQLQELSAAIRQALA